ncbi:MAG TPA: hypothetical protein VH439_02300 [Gemmatimonadales bacterium]|jgi:hypothetical protein
MRLVMVFITLYATALVSLDAQARGCADTQFPAELPTPGALVDSAHAIEDLGAFADPAKPMLFSVYFITGDSVAHVRALDKQDAAAAVSMANYIRHAAPGDFWAYRVRLAGGDTPALTLERAKYCPPVTQEHDRGYATRATITGTIAVAGNPEPISPPPGSNPSVDAGSFIPVEALISAEGRVVLARVVRSSGNADQDARIVSEVKRWKFQSAKLDDQPIQGVYRSAGESPRP